MPLTMPRPGTKLIGPASSLEDQDGDGAVTNRLSSEAGSSHFQAKPISWSIRTRGRVPRIQTKVNTKT